MNKNKGERPPYNPRERFMATPESMRLVGKDEDLGTPLYDINDESHAAAFEKVAGNDEDAAPPSQVVPDEK